MRVKLVRALTGRTQRGRKDIARVHKCLFQELQTPAVEGTSWEAAATAFDPGNAASWESEPLLPDPLDDVKAQILKY